MIDLSDLPRGTTYTVRQVTKGADLNAALGGTDVRINRMGDRWAIDVTVPAIRNHTCGMALLADLNRGRAEGVAILFPQPGLCIRGTPGSVVVDGADQTGTTLNVKGGNQNFLLRKGQFFSVSKTVGAGTRRYLYQVTADTRIDADGEAALPIWPMLRRSPDDEDVIEILAPRIEGLLQGSGQEWTPTSLGSLGLSFTIQERA